MLTSDEIKSFLSYPVPVEVLDIIDSTNTELKRRLHKGLNGPYILAANEQTNGRGRQGKSFYSPADTGLYFSILISGEFSYENAVSVTSRAAVAVASAIELLTSFSPKIKWVNDIYLKNKKICGILVESELSRKNEAVSAFIIGIGINISTTDFPSGLCLAGSIGEKVNRNLLLAEIVNNLLRSMNEIKDDSYMNEYRRRSMVLNQIIGYEINGKNYHGEVEWIDNKCNLFSREPDGTLRKLNSGEISIHV